jgi:hypothetical protein
MLSSWLVALSVAVSPGQCATCGPVDGGMMGGGMAFSPGMTSGSWSAGMGGFGNPYDAVSMGGGGGGDQLYPFDSPEPWLWGYFQEIPAYGGYASFRPHNYKHVLAQMDVAARWGISPTMAYSHQWYHRYRQRGGMHPNFGTPYAASSEPSYGDIASIDSSAPSVPDRSYSGNTSDDSLIQAAAMERGYSGTPIPGISVPSYQFATVPEGRNALGDEYQSRIAQMQQHLDQQKYEMQVLRQQLQNNRLGRFSIRTLQRIQGSSLAPRTLLLRMRTLSRGTRSCLLRRRTSSMPPHSRREVCRQFCHSKPMDNRAIHSLCRVRSTHRNLLQRTFSRSCTSSRRLQRSFRSKPLRSSHSR